MGSRFPHPEVPSDRGDGDAWREVFPRVEDGRWRDTTAWVRSLYQPRPEYPIEYPPPKEEPEGVEPDPDAQEPIDEAPVPSEPGEVANPEPTGGDGPR